MILWLVWWYALIKLWFWFWHTFILYWYFIPWWYKVTGNRAFYASQDYMLCCCMLLSCFCCLVLSCCMVCMAHTRNNKIVQHACIMLWISLWITFVVVIVRLWISWLWVVDKLIQHVFARFTQVKHVREHVFFLCKNAYKLY